MVSAKQKKIMSTANTARVVQLFKEPRCKRYKTKLECKDESDFAGTSNENFGKARWDSEGVGRHGGY